MSSSRTQLRELSRLDLAAVVAIATVTIATVSFVVMGAMLGPVHASPINVVHAEGESMQVENQILVLEDVTQASVGDRVVWDTGETHPHHEIVREEAGGFVTKGTAKQHVDQPYLPHATESNIYGTVLFSVPVWTLEVLGAVFFSLLLVAATPKQLRGRVRSRESAAVTVVVLLVVSASFAGVAAPSASKTTDASTESRQINSAPVNSSTFFTTDGNGVAYRGTYSGSEEWRNSYDGGDQPAAVMGANGDFWANGGGSYLYKLNSSTGSVEWQLNPAGWSSVVTGMEPLPGGDMMVVTHSGNISRIDQDGTIEWSIDRSDVYKSHAIGVSPDGNVFVGHSNGHILKLDSDGNELLNESTGLGTFKALHVGETGVYGQTGGTITRFEFNLTQDWSVSPSGHDGGSDLTVVGDYVYSLDKSQGSDSTFFKLDKSTGSTVDTFTPNAGGDALETVKPGPDGSIVAAGYGGSNGVIVRVDSSLSELSRTSLSSSGTESLATPQANQHVLSGSDGGNSVSGVVRDENGEPVSNSTVKVVGVDHSQIQLENADSLEERADDLLEQARNPKPPAWDEDLKLTGSSGLFGDVSSEYPAVHSQADWGLEQWTDTTSLGDPNVQVPANQPIVLSAWDPTKSSLIESEVNRDLPGKTTDSDVTLTHLDPTGDAVKTETIPLSQTYQVGVVQTSEHAYAKVELSPGFYEVSVENSSVSYTIVAGNPDEVAAEISKDLRDEADSLTDHATDMRERFQNGKFVSETVTTNENGSFSVSLPENVKTVSATAYKVPAGMDPENATRADIREYYNTMNFSRPEDPEQLFEISRDDFDPEEANLTAAADLDEPVPAFYLPSTEARVDIPAGNVSLEVYKTDVPTFAEMGVTANRSQLREWFLSNLTYGDLPSALQDQWNATNQSLQDVRNELNNVTQANEELRREFEELLAEQRNTSVEEVREQLAESEKSREALRQEVAALRQIIAEQDNTITIPDPEVERAQETVSLAWSLPGALEDGNVSVLAHYANGTTRAVPGEYVSVDEGGTLSDPVVRVSEYPLGASDPSSVQFELQAASGEGWGSGSEVVKNPTFDGQLPSLDSVSVSSVNPGPSENVTVSVSPSEASSWKEITSVTVLGLDRSTVGTGPVEDGDTFRFTTAGEGAHTARITAETTDGSTVEVPVRIKAVGREVDASPTLSVKESPVGEYVLTSGEFDRAEVSTENARENVQVTAQLPSGDEVPSQVDVHLEELSTPADSTVSIKFVRGADEQSVSKHVPVRVHMAAPSGELLLWRNGDAVNKDGGKWGEARAESDALVIKTFTDDSGGLEIEKQNDAGLVAQFQHSFARFVQGFSLLVSIPALPAQVPMPTPATAGQAVLADTAPIATPGPANTGALVGVVA